MQIAPAYLLPASKTHTTLAAKKLVRWQSSKASQSRQEPNPLGRRGLGPSVSPSRYARRIPIPFAQWPLFPQIEDLADQRTSGAQFVVRSCTALRQLGSERVGYP